MKVRTEEDLMEYINSYGWEVDVNTLSCEEIVIPEVFGDVYLGYAELQERQGFDLKKYAGKIVTRYSCEISNYPTGERGVLVNVMVFNERVIGADITSPRLDGFMHGLLYE